MLVKQYKMVSHVLRSGKKLLNYYLKLMPEQEEYKSTNNICYLENICRSKYIPLSPERAEKQANEGENYLFQRFWRVLSALSLSASADRILLDL